MGKKPHDAPGVTPRCSGLPRHQDGEELGKTAQIYLSKNLRPAVAHGECDARRILYDETRVLSGELPSL